MTTLPIHFLAAYGTRYDKPLLLACAEEVMTYSFWIRGTLREFLHFAGRSLAANTSSGQRLLVTLDREGFIGHSYCRPDGLVVVAITTSDYSSEHAQRLLQLALQRYPDERWMLESEDNKAAYTPYQSLVTQYQKPRDVLKEVQAQTRDVLAATKITVEKLLERGDNLDVLIKKSDDLSTSSKKFVEGGKDMNSCCWRWLGWRRRR